MARITLTPLDQLLRECDISQVMLSRELNLSQSMISQVVLGRRVPSLEVAEILTDFFQKKGYKDITELVFLYPNRYIQVVEYKNTLKEKMAEMNRI